MPIEFLRAVRKTNLIGQRRVQPVVADHEYREFWSCSNRDALTHGAIANVTGRVHDEHFGEFAQAVENAFPTNSHFGAAAHRKKEGDFWRVNLFLYGPSPDLQAIKRAWVGRR